MNSTQLCQTINHYFDQLSGDRLCWVGDLLKFLVQSWAIDLLNTNHFSPLIQDDL